MKYSIPENCFINCELIFELVRVREIMHNDELGI